MANWYVDGAVGSDANAGTSPGAGNAFATVGKGDSVAAAGDTVWIKGSASYVLTASITLAASGSTAAGKITWQGYSSATGDSGTATITSATNSVALVNNNAVNYRKFRQINFTHTAATRGPAFTDGASAATLFDIGDCTFNGFSYVISCGNRGIANLAFSNNYVTGCTTGGILNAASSELVGNHFWNNTGDQFSDGGNSGAYIFLGNIFSKGGNGIYLTGAGRSYEVVLDGNTFANNASSAGFRCDATTASGGVLNLVHQNNLYFGNGTYGVNIPNLTSPAADTYCYVNRNNAYGNNTSGARNGLSAGQNDQSLSTTDPFVSSSAGNFALSSSGPDYAKLKAVGFQGAFTGGLTTGYLDIGAVQHQDAGGGGSSIVIQRPIVANTYALIG